MRTKRLRNTTDFNMNGKKKQKKEEGEGNEKDKLMTPTTDLKEGKKGEREKL